jgi:peroxiredoxin
VEQKAKRLAAWLAVHGAATLLLYSIVCQASGEPQLKDRAPALTIKTADGGDFDLEAMRGKVVLVDFWATWCAPCLAEMPAIEKYYRKHKADGFEVIALSTDKPRNREKALSVLERNGLPGALLSDAARNGFGPPDAVPISYVVDAQGIVRDRFIEIDEKLLDKVVAPLLKEASAAQEPTDKNK